MQILGEKRVRVNFNITGDDLVHQIKSKSAELIDLCELMRICNEDGQSGTGEKQRLLSLAQTEFESGAMWEVKANFTI